MGRLPGATKLLGSASRRWWGCVALTLRRRLGSACRPSRLFFIQVDVCRHSGEHREGAERVLAGGAAGSFLAAAGKR